MPETSHYEQVFSCRMTPASQCRMLTWHRPCDLSAEDVLGDSFDIMAFHDIVLGSGPLPMALLESKVERWIDASREALSIFEWFAGGY